jgi:D-alanine-D-alanine ligase
VSLCIIDKSGKWWLADEFTVSSEGSPMLVPALGTGRLATVPFKKVIEPDVILPILHGENGEDGTVQGLAELLHVPIVGPSMLSALLAMDKDVTKRLLKQAGIPVVDWITIRSNDPVPEFDEVKNQLGMPVFIKPAATGSSYGVSKVTGENEYSKAVQESFKYGDKVLIEKAIKGRELEVSVLGNRKAEATAPGEVRTREEFYNYYAKYDESSGTEFDLPAKNLDQAEIEKIRTLAIQAYKAVEGRGMSRVDFFLSESGEIYVNEINTIPGFTGMSVYPKLWESEGLSYNELIEKLVMLALEDE